MRKQTFIWLFVDNQLTKEQSKKRDKNEPKYYFVTVFWCLKHVCRDTWLQEQTKIRSSDKRLFDDSSLSLKASGRCLNCLHLTNTATNNDNNALQSVNESNKHHYYVLSCVCILYVWGMCYSYKDSRKVCLIQLLHNYAITKCLKWILVHLTHN